MDGKGEGSRWIQFVCIVCMGMVVLPLLVLGHFDYPSADDWSLANLTHHALESGGGPGGVVRAVGETVRLWREKGEPRYANALLGSIQPGIWGEHCYRITPWLMIGGLVTAQTICCAYLLKAFRASDKWLVLPIIFPSLMIQILCVPYPVETFYWYVGSVNYTFTFSVSLIALTVYLRLQGGCSKRGQTVWRMIGGSLLTALAVGSNYATGLSAVCLFTALSLRAIWHRNKKGFLRSLPITVTAIVGLLVCATAPGNQVRVSTEFVGRTMGAGEAVIRSLERAVLLIYSWTTWKIVWMVLLILPFLWRALRNSGHTFRYPALFTLFSYGIYASQIVPTMYVGGNTGGGRMADILYYAYHIWVLSNVGYWLGWIQRKVKWEKIPALCSLKNWVGRRLLLYFVTVGLCLAGIICATELSRTSTYRACAWLFKGYAQDYAAVWEGRLEILRDDSVREVLFDPLQVPYEMVFYADFEPGENWVNSACADYYDKEYVGLKPDS
ncbi:MAG: DUF6056 family protein [Clostridium sp.]|nr:DUF6056 family protein [Acetatifactor muris]MCM1526908.1 DUF6056 family protein [Bacteroides sp.]MCM1563298.1 DUF6056 family protein [Clostridium sp.]